MACLAWHGITSAHGPCFVSRYQSGPAKGAARDAIRAAIKAHVDSPEYQARLKRILTSNLTGIIIPAGGPRLVTNLLVTLKVLREHHKSSLPVEVMWQGKGEMDDNTWASIEKRFGPIRGIDIQSTPHPVKGLHRK